MTPRQHAIAFRTWQAAEPKGWDITIRDVAEQIGVSTKQVSSIVRMKGWQTRFRSIKMDHRNLGWRTDLTGSFRK